MKKTLKLRFPAPIGSVFDQDAFKNVDCRNTKLRLGREIIEAKVLGAQVGIDGSWVDLAVEIEIDDKDVQIFISPDNLRLEQDLPANPVTSAYRRNMFDKRLLKGGIMAKKVVTLALEEFVAKHQCLNCKSYGYPVVSTSIKLACDCNTDVSAARELLNP